LHPVTRIALARAAKIVDLLFIAFPKFFVCLRLVF